MEYTNHSSKTHHCNHRRSSPLSDDEDELILPGYPNRRPSITLTLPDSEKTGKVIGSDEELNAILKIPPPSPRGGRKSPICVSSDSDDDDDLPNGVLRFNDSYSKQDLYDINCLTEEEIQALYKIAPPPSPIPGRKSPAFVDASNFEVMTDNSVSDEELQQRYNLPPPPSPIPGRKSPCFGDNYNQDFESSDSDLDVVSRSCENINNTVIDSSINKSNSAGKIPPNIYKKNLPLINQSTAQQYTPVYSYRVDLSNVMPQPYVKRYKDSILSQGLNSVHHVEAPTSKKSDHSLAQSKINDEDETYIHKESKDNNGKIKISLKSKISERENLANDTTNSRNNSPKPQPRSVYPTIGTDKVTFSISKEPKTVDSEWNEKSLAVASPDSDEDLSFEESLAISALEDAVDESLKLYSCSNEPFNSYDELENMKEDESNDEQPESSEASSYIQHDEYTRQVKSSEKSGDHGNSYNTLSKESLDGYLSNDMNSLKNFIATDEESDWDFSYVSCSSQGEPDTDSEVDTNQDKTNLQAPKKKKKKISMGKKLFNRNKENKNKDKNVSPRNSPSPNLTEALRKDGKENKSSPSRFGSMNIFKSGAKNKSKEEGRISNIDTAGNTNSGWSTSEMEEFLMKNQEQNLKLGLLDEDDIKDKNTKNQNISQEKDGNWSAEAMEKYLMNNKDTNLKLGLLDQEDMIRSKSSGYTQKVAPVVSVHETQYIKRQNPISLQEVKDTADEGEGWSKSAMEDYLMQNKEENLRLGLLDEEDVAYNEAKRNTAGVMADPRPAPKVTVHDVVVIDTEKFFQKKQDFGGSTLQELKTSRTAAAAASKMQNDAPNPITHNPSSNPHNPSSNLHNPSWNPHNPSSNPHTPSYNPHNPSSNLHNPSSKPTEAWKGPATLQELKASRMAARLQQKSPSSQQLYSSQQISPIRNSQALQLEVENRILSLSLPNTPKSHPVPQHRTSERAPKSKKAPSIPNKSPKTTDRSYSPVQYSPHLTPMKEAMAVTPGISMVFPSNNTYHSDNETDEFPQTPMKVAIAASPAVQRSHGFGEETPMKVAIAASPAVQRSHGFGPKPSSAKKVQSKPMTPMNVAKKNAAWTAKDMEKYLLEQDIDQQMKLGFVTDEEVEIRQWKEETGLVPICDTRWTRESLRKSKIIHASSTDSILANYTPPTSPPESGRGSPIPGWSSPTCRSPTDSVLSSPSHAMGGIGPGLSPKRTAKKLKKPRSSSPAPSQKTSGHLAFRGFKLGKRMVKRAFSTQGTSKNSSLAGSNQHIDDHGSHIEIQEHTEYGQMKDCVTSSPAKVAVITPDRKEGPIARIGRLLGKGEPDSPKSQQISGPSAPAHALFLAPTTYESEDEEEGGVRKKIGDMRLKLNFFRRRDDVSVRPIPEEAQLWADSFHNLMASKYGQALFKAFLQREFSEENVEFWLAVEDYKKTRSNKLASKATKIHTDYVAVRAPKEINIDSDTRANIGKNLECPDKTIFDIAQKRVQSLMEADSYLRFLQSELYKDLLHPETSENKPETL